MPAKPELVIPLKMDLAEALKAITDLDARLNKLTKESKEGLEGAGKEAKGLGSTLADIAAHQGYAIAKDLAQGMLSAFKESADYAKGISEEFVKQQQTMQQIAALMGRDNSDRFTREQADLAVQANLTTPEWVRFQEQFQSFGGAFLEGDQKRIKTPEDAIKYQQYVAEFAKARGVDPMQAAQLAGGILQFSDKEITAQEGVAQFGKIFKTLERAPTPVNQLLPQLTRVMAQGASGQEAAQLLTLASEFAPGEEGTYVDNTLKALRNALLEGKGDELGIKEGMSPLEQVKAASAKIDERVRGGENENAVLSEYFKDLREFRGMRGYLNRGQRAGGFGRVRGYIDQTPDNAVETALDEWEQSDAGRRAGLVAEEQWAKVARGQELAPIAEARMKAKNQLILEGRFEETTVGDVFRGTIGRALGYGSKEEQLTDQRAYQNLLKDAGQGDYVGDAVKGNVPNMVLQDEMVKWLRVIAESNEKMAQQEPGPRPLVAPAPRVQRAPGG